MIEHIALSSDTISIGDTVSLTVHAASPITVQIGCFVDNPPPPGFRGCAECQIQKVQSGEAVTIEANPDTWRNWTGKFQITITDAAGDERELTIPVAEPYYRSESGGATMSM